MRHLVVAVAVLAACSDASAPAARAVLHERREAGRAVSVADLEFDDEQLQWIAARLVREARLRGIHESVGRNRVERLIALEASLGRSTLALHRVEVLVSRLIATDGSQWAKLRRKAERDFGDRRDEVGTRVRDLLAGWQRRRMESAYGYLSSNYGTSYITSFEWERRFHAFVSERPVDAATWGWLVLREYAAETRQQYGRADAESAYRFYLELSGLGDGREARRIFSLPGIEVVDAPQRSRR